MDQKFSRHFSWFSRRWFFLLGSREGRRMRSQREGQHFYSKRVFSFDWRDLFLPCKSDWQRPVDPLNCDKKRWGVGRWSSRTTRNQWRGNEINHLDRGHCQKKEFVRTRHLMMDFPDEWTLGYWNSKPSANPIVWSASIDSKWISWDNFLSSLIWVNIFISGTWMKCFPELFSDEQILWVGGLIYFGIGVAKTKLHRKSSCFGSQNRSDIVVMTPTPEGKKKKRETWRAQAKKLFWIE